MDRKHRIEIWVAVIAAVGAVVVAVVANLDKFRHDSAPPPGIARNQYTPSDDLEIEIRRNVDLMGLREMIQAMKSRVEAQYKEKYKLTDEQLACVMDSSFFANEYIDLLVNAQKKYVTLAEMQEINRFFSSDTMTGFRRKQGAIALEATVQMEKLVEQKFNTFRTLTGSSATGSSSDLRGKAALSCPKPAKRPAP